MMLSALDKEMELTDDQKNKQIIELLRYRHPAPEWAHFTEIPSSTGGHQRRIDFYAYNLWPSKRFLKIAYEIKVSRADFARELSKPVKREFAESVADECYFVAPAKLVSVDEVPEGWGLMVIQANGLKIIKHATQRKIDNLPLGFIASLARRLSDKPSELPECIWLVAGREVGKEELLQAAKERLDIYVYEQRQEAVDNFREGNLDYKNTRMIRDLIRTRVGYREANYPDVFEQWLNQVLAQQPKSLNGDVKRRLKELHQMLGEMIDC